MLDVLDKIKPLLEFSEDTFYFLQIIQRKKDQVNKELHRESRIIQNYYIDSLEYLESHYDEIKLLCKTFNARAMLRLNKRSYKRTSFEMLALLAKQLGDNQIKSSKSIFSRVAGKYHSDKEKKWLVDIDDVDYFEDSSSYGENELRKLINSCEPVGEKVITRLPTKNGIHLITRPFNVKQFNDGVYMSIDIHKDNPINLYIPD